MPYKTFIKINTTAIQYYTQIIFEHTTMFQKDRIGYMHFDHNTLLSVFIELELADSFVIGNVQANLGGRGQCAVGWWYNLRQWISEPLSTNARIRQNDRVRFIISHRDLIELMGPRGGKKSYTYTRDAVDGKL